MIDANEFHTHLGDNATFQLSNDGTIDVFPNGCDESFSINADGKTFVRSEGEFYISRMSPSNTFNTVANIILLMQDGWALKSRKFAWTE